LKLNWKRWLIVVYLLSLMLFTTSILLIPGEKYDTLTTSDSGWFYDVAVGINNENGLIDNNPLSHAPYGHSVSLSDQGQPLMTVMLYKAIHAVAPGVTLMDVVRYWSPFLFALVLIPIFLIGKELGGDLAGCTAAFFASVLAGSIYWMKAGAFDREATQLILTAWIMYLTIKMSKARGWQTLKFGILSGLVLAIFALTWPGYEVLIPILLGWAALVVLSERLTYLPPTLGVGIIIGIYTAKLSYLLYAIVGALVLAVIMEMIFHKMSAKDLLYGIFKGIRSHLALIGGIGAVFVAMTVAVTFIGVASPYLWVGLTQTLFSYIGIGGGGGISFGRYAQEMKAPSSWSSVVDTFYVEKILTAIALILVVLALIKICWPRKRGEMLKRGELLMLPWLVILAGLVWPGSGQARFDRMWWPFVAVAAGAGVMVVVSLVKRMSRETMTAEWAGPLQKPVVIALCFSLAATPFIVNVHTYAQGVTSPPEWSVPGLDAGLMEAFTWLRENTPENSVVAIGWSYGHLLTGTAGRGTVCDGGQTTGENGKWENTEPSPPPDYIYYVQDSAAVYFNSSWTINGRRTDVQRFLRIDKNEFQWYLNTYRENYGVKIDYMVSDYAEYCSAWFDQLLKKYASSRQAVGNTVVFGFDGGQDNIVFDQSTGAVYREIDGVIENLWGYSLIMVYNNNMILYDAYGQVPFWYSWQGDGYALHVNYVVGVGGRLGDRLFRQYQIPNTLEALTIFIDEDMNPMGAGLTTLETQQLLMGIKVFENMLDDVNYLDVAFTSSNNLVKISKVYHLPSLISPAYGVATNNNTPTFTWSGAVGAVEYEIWVDNNADFSSPEIENVSDTTYTSSSVLSDGSYSWRVRAFKDDNTELGWSLTWTFTVDTIPPAAAALHSPENGATISDNTPTFEWTVGADATKHRLLIDNNIDFSSPMVDVTLDAPENTYTSPELAVDSYWWKIIASDRAGNENESQVWTFNLE